LREYAAAGRAAREDGNRGVRRYLVPPSSDPQLTQEFAALLQRNGIEVGVTTTATRTLPAGTLVIEAAQPRNRLIRTLMEPHLQIPRDFLEQARERVVRGQNPRFYDITAYS